MSKKKAPAVSTAPDMKGGDQAKKKEAEEIYKEVQKIMKKDHVTKSDYHDC